MKNHKMLPPTYLFAAILLMAAMHFLLPLSRVILFPWRLLGIIPLSLGLALNLVANKAFKKHNTTVKPFEKSTTLIKDGLFRFTRNPMYLGFLCILTGLGVFLGSFTPFVIVPVFAVLMEFVFIRAEERSLAETFPEEWPDYKAKVNRWILGSPGNLSQRRNNRL